MNTKELINWLTLHLAPNFGPASWQYCFSHFSSISEFCQLDRRSLHQLGLTHKTISAIISPNNHQIQSILNWAQMPNHHLMTLQDHHYPSLLKQIAHPPPILYAQGRINLLNNNQLAVIGSRRPSLTGLDLSCYFANELSRTGFTITSGLALGIDAAAHQGALKQPNSTIAVLGSGLNINYPYRNAKLADKIREHGLIISEFSPNTPPKAQHFPRRNRIISGLSLGTLVIEATLKSGSLITAKLALEQGREVFAVPGSILNPNTSGCHHLIQQGAKLTTAINDILDELKPITPLYTSQTHPKLVSQTATLDKPHQKLVECIGFEATSFEQLMHRTGFSAQKLSTMLCNLTLNGYIKEELGGYSQAAV